MKAVIYGLEKEPSRRHAMPHVVFGTLKGRGKCPETSDKFLSSCFGSLDRVCTYVSTLDTRTMPL